MYNIRKLNLAKEEETTDMAIEGLRKAQPNPTDEIGASVEALYRLGLVEDLGRVAETVTAGFNALTRSSGKTGDAYVQLPRSLVTLPTMIEVLDSGTYPSYTKYLPAQVDDALWTASAVGCGYEADDIGNLEVGKHEANWPAHVRLAVHNPVSEAEPLLHFLNQPFDEEYAKAGEQTQLQAIAEAKAAYEAERSDMFTMIPLNVSAVAMIALTRRIKGESIPVEWGFMRDATLPRITTVGGRSRVGSVFCRYNDGHRGQLWLGRSRGEAKPNVGVGLSVGEMESKPQAS